MALVGPNGAGKTTLLRTLAGELSPAAGMVRLPEQFAWLPQETTPLDDVAHLLAYDHLLAASHLAGIRDHMAGLNDQMHAADMDAIDDFGHLEERFRLGGGYELESTAERIAAGLGLDEEALLREVGSLSGGQRRRLELARVLLAGGDLLMLDEPTNHLDAEAKAFVMGFLRTSPSAVLVVSHDIELMNESIDRVFALEQGHLDIYRGTYRQFLEKRADREAAIERETTKAEREVARLQRTADKFRQGNATSARKRKGLEQRIGRINDEQAGKLSPVKRRKLGVRFPDPVRAGDVVLTVDGLTKRLGDQHGAAQGGLHRRQGRGLPRRRAPTAPARPRCCAAWPASTPTTPAASASAPTSPSGTTPRSTRTSRPAPASSTPSRRRPRRGSPPPSCGPSSATSASSATSPTRTRRPCRAGRRPSCRSPASWRVGPTSCCSTSPPTTSTSSSREAVLAALQHFKGTVVLVSHDIDFVTQLAPKHAIVLPSGKLLPFDERMLDLVPQTGPSQSAPVPAARQGADSRQF